MTDPALPDDAPGPDPLPRRTTPTWEVELLISGIAVFAMLQLPGWLDDRMFELLPRFEREWADSFKVIYIYLKSAALILAVTFSLHLLMRAQWIATVGMHSVFPGGVRWDKLRMGAIQRATEMRHYGDSDLNIDRADNRATIVFSLGVMLASVLLLISALVAGLFAIAAIAEALGASASVGPNLLFYGILAVTLPALLARLIDRRYGERLKPGGAPHRALAAVFGVYGRLGIMGRGSNPTFSLLSSHRSERVTVVLTTVLMAVAALCASYSLVWQRDPGEIGNYAWFPQFADGSRTVDSAHYDDQRNPARDDNVPYIRSAVSIGPYLQLVVPYQPRRDEAALRAACPTRDAHARDAARLACLQALRAVTLDGRPVPALRYDVGSDARTDRPALVAMIDVRALAPGRHELQVRRGDAARVGKDDTAAGSDRIPFWR